MRTDRIGIDVDDLRLPIKDGLRRAAEMQMRHVEFATVRGDLAPQHLSPSGRRHLQRYAGGMGLAIDALTADMPGLRFVDPATIDERVQRTCQILELAADLNVPIVTASLGELPGEQDSNAVAAITQALQRVGEVADSRGTIFAVRPSRMRGEDVAELLKTINCPSLRVALDPGALVMHGVNPLGILEFLPQDVVLFHARDAIAGSADRAGAEAALGEGEVDLIGVLACLDAADYRGPYMLRRTTASDPARELAQARDRLDALLAGQ